MNRRRVVITGMGIISPSGNDLTTFWNNINDGKSKIEKISKFDTSLFDTKIGGEVKDFNLLDYGFKFMLSRTIDLFTQYALATTQMALEDSKLNLDAINKEEMGVFTGNCLGGVGFGERELYNLYTKGADKVSPYQAISWFYTAAQGQISIHYGLKGYSKTFVADRISSDAALGYAYKSILLNRIERAVVCGTEAPFVPYGFLGFMKNDVFSKNNLHPDEAYRPYDASRDGMVLGEGAGTLVVEELNSALERNAHIYAEIMAYCSNNDGVHFKNHDQTGEGYKDVIEECISRANLTIDDIDYINLDGSALREDDYIETKVLKEIFGDKIENVALSCPKSMFGNTYGAAGAIDSIINCLVIKNNRIPPTINYKNVDKECDLNYTANKSIDKQVDTVLQIARGRGGINSALIFKRYR